MSQTNTNTNPRVGNTNQNRNAGRGGWGQRGSDGKGHSSRGSDHRNNSISKYSFEGKMKDGCLSKLTITKSGYRATQFKKIIDALPVFCADKNYRYLDDVICTRIELNYLKLLSYRHIRTQDYGQAHTMEILTLSTQMRQ